MPAVHQFVAGFSMGDAISDEARLLQGVFRSWGRESRIFCEARRILPELRRWAEDAELGAAACAPRDVALLHLSIGSPVNELFANLSCRKAILYHNVTPAEYFAVINPATARSLARGREQVARLANVAAVNLADSAFNARELTALGYRDVRVLPLVLDLARLAGPSEPRCVAELGDGRRNLLFVGRCAPNKRLDALLDVFECFHRCVDGNSRLVHAGSFAGVERYHGLLLARARELGIAERVLFAGAVPQARLNAFYACAHVFVCMSEHEGFCIPLLESMARDVPVLARAAAAVPETLDGAGVLFTDAAPELVAEMAGRLIEDRPLRAAVIERQRERVRRYERRDLPAELRAHLAPLLD